MSASTTDFSLASACAAPRPSDEDQRLQALCRTGVLDSLPEQIYDDLVELAAGICGKPMAMVSLVDRDRQWFKAKVGTHASETPRDWSFCAHAILQPDTVLLVNDAREDQRFRDSPLVTGASHVRSYAGVPIVLASGHAVGTLCVIDTEPSALRPEQIDALKRLARQAGALLGMRETALATEAANQALRRSEQRLRLLADSLPALVTLVDTEQRYTFANAQVVRTFGVPPESIYGRTMLQVRGETRYRDVAEHVAAALSGRYVSFQSSAKVMGRTYHYQSDYIPDCDIDGKVLGFYAVTFDITELKEIQSQLESLALSDGLTGLPNRRHFESGLRQAMERTRTTGLAMVVMFLDIDHFKQINDSLGHGGGDEVLREFARRLKDNVRQTDLVARLAGDEFVIVLENIDGWSTVANKATQILQSIRCECAAGGTAIQITASIGAARYEGEDLPPARLLEHADAALYQSKKRGRDCFSVFGGGQTLALENQTTINA